MDVLLAFYPTVFHIIDFYSSVFFNYAHNNFSPISAVNKLYSVIITVSKFFYVLYGTAFRVSILPVEVGAWLEYGNQCRF